MTNGKATAQAGHAFQDAYLKSLFTDFRSALKDGSTTLQNFDSFREFFAASAHQSIAGEYLGDSHGTKITLKAKNLSALLKAKEEAERAGLPCALITDANHIHPPHFDGSPIITALGIGPCRRHEIHHITKRFSSF